MPQTRGNLCVPPAPGNMPKCTSGNPTEAEGEANLQCVASAVSKPPPNANPLIFDIRGLS